MANIKSQIKRIKTNEKARQRNIAVRSEVKTYAKKVRTSVASGDKQAAQENLKIATQKYDKAVGKGVFHKNNASNKKSALASLVNSIKEVTATKEEKTPNDAPKSQTTEVKTKKTPKKSTSKK